MTEMSRTEESGSTLARSKYSQGTALAAVAILALSACAPEGSAEFEEGEPTATANPTEGTVEEEPTESPETEEETEEDDEDVLVAEIDDPVEITECKEAEDDDAATVTWLDDVVIEEQRNDQVQSVSVEISGEDLVIPGAPAVVIPERVGQAGCIIEYDAPGGCLPAVEISPSYIPGYTLPGRSIPEYELPDGTVLPELTQEEVEVSAVEGEGTRVEEACQPDESEVEEGEYVSMAVRSLATRSLSTQSLTTQSLQTRSLRNTEDGMIPQMLMPQILVPQMLIPQVLVPQEILEGYRLEGSSDTERTDRHDQVSYVTEGDVLFDSDQYELRSDAESELQAIADDIAEREDDYVIEVEGHTDDLPTSVYDDNQELSELRAESVVQWLVDNADVDQDAITAIGRGEDYPRADNGTDEGRQQNRRVVITVEPVDGGEAEVEYELEEED